LRMRAVKPRMLYCIEDGRYSLLAFEAKDLFGKFWNSSLFVVLVGKLNIGKARLPIAYKGNVCSQVLPTSLLTLTNQTAASLDMC
jgi:hypothetical protein